MGSPTTIRVGQIWADNDRRARKTNHRQRLEVLAVDGTKARLAPEGGGIARWVRTARMNGSNTGYRLVEDRDAPDPCAGAVRDALDRVRAAVEGLDFGWFAPSERTHFVEPTIRAVLAILEPNIEDTRMDMVDGTAYRVKP